MALWSGYQDFLVIAKAGSLSAAARQLGLTQPTLSRRLAQVESEAGTRLLARTPAGITLTPAGERMLATLEKVSVDLIQMESELTESDVSLRGTVRISVTETLGIVWLAPLMAEFNEAYPHIQVELVIDNAMVNLLSREAHIAIRLLRPSQADLIARQVGRLNIGLFASKGYADRYGLPDTPKQATTHRALGLLGITPTAILTSDIFPVERHVFQSNSLLAIYHALQVGTGIGPVLSMVPHMDKSLVPCLEAHRLEKEVWLTAVPELRDNVRIRAVYDFLVDRLAGVVA